MKSETRSRIETRAYEIWEREGCPDGKATEHWRQAVAEIAREDGEAAADINKPGAPKKPEKAKSPATAKKSARKSKASEDGRNADTRSRPKSKSGTGKKSKKTGK